MAGLSGFSGAAPGCSDESIVFRCVLISAASRAASDAQVFPAENCRCDWRGPDAGAGERAAGDVTGSLVFDSVRLLGS